eukprot:TRINITY_DN30214_c0_g1_i1.p1 TRINITY_DN30214_c0_g1~~TRINITY_DN30214_c0_g1_i1.p1  ORF type:complete len:198 (+),score=69.11 TRINITY_DN30214_c0_g1_i1:57-650(+)
MFENITDALGDYLADLADGHQEALDEIHELWRNHSGPLGDYEVSLEGLQKMTSEASSQFMGEVNGFISAVDWSEPWLMGLLAVHALVWGAFLFSCVVTTSAEYKMGFFMLIAVLCGSAGYLNALGAAHWRSFANIDYFDDSGLFLAVMWCAPMLLLLFCCLLQLLFEAAKMMVKVKVSQLKQRKRAEQKPTSSKKND